MRTGPKNHHPKSRTPVRSEQLFGRQSAGGFAARLFPQAKQALQSHQRFRVPRSGLLCTAGRKFFPALSASPRLPSALPSQKGEASDDLSPAAASPNGSPSALERPSCSAPDSSRTVPGGGKQQFQPCGQACRAPQAPARLSEACALGFRNRSSGRSPACISAFFLKFPFKVKGQGFLTTEWPA